jgi:hypothetical protein
MINRVNKVLIGKDITRTAALTSATLYTDTNGPADGEVIVLDKNKKLLSAGATIADTDTVYVAVANADTYSYVTEGTGTTVTGVRRLLLSDPIVGSDVIGYKGRAYSAAVAQVVTITPSLTVAIGTEYVIRIVYTDTNEHPGQVTATYRVIPTAATVADLIDKFVAKINADTHRRVDAVDGTSYMTLTGRVMPYHVTDSVDALDSYYQVAFKVFLTSANFTAATTVVYTTAPFPGNGTWQRVRDAEQTALGYRGVHSKIAFPYAAPTMRVVKDETYDAVVIEHNVPYQSPDNQYVKRAPVTTEVYIPNTATSNQMTDVLAVLNPWMASLPGAFTNVSF